MDIEKHERHVSMLCPVCGSDRFSFDDALEDGPVTCANCGRVTTRDDLIRENSEVIDANVRTMGREIEKDAAKEIEKAFRKAFKGR